MARVSSLVRRAATIAAVLAVAGVAGLLPLADVRAAIPVRGAWRRWAASSCDMVQARRASPQRLVLVGARHDVEAYAARVSGHRSALLVGGLRGRRRSGA